MPQRSVDEALKDAMKRRDTLRVSALRMFKAAIRNREIELGREASENEIAAVARKLIKQREEAAAQYEAAGRAELAEKERAEAEVLRAFLPQMLSPEELDAAIEEALRDTQAQSARDMGRVMGWLKARYGARVDMAEAARRVRARLS